MSQGHSVVPACQPAGRSGSHPQPADISGRQRRSSKLHSRSKALIHRAEELQSAFWMTNLTDCPASGLQRGPLRHVVRGDIMHEKNGALILSAEPHP